MPGCGDASWASTMRPLFPVCESGNLRPVGARSPIFGKSSCVDVVVVVAVGVLAGLLAAALLSRWPRAHPAAPRLPAAVVREEVERHPRIRRVLRSRLDAEE